MEALRKLISYIGNYFENERTIELIDEEVIQMKELDVEANKGDKALKDAVGIIIHRISDTLPDLKEPIKMFLAGGMAINFYTGYRPTGDIDASFSHKLILPKANDLFVSYLNSDGRPQVVFLDTNYNPSFALLHPDYERDSLRVAGSEFQNAKLNLFILAPVDLALSKIARFEGNDREDIAELARNKLITAKSLNDRSKEALEYYVGSQGLLLTNLKDAVRIIQDAQKKVIAPKGKGYER